MKYTVRNVTLDIDKTDGELTGDCILYIPFKHKKFFKEACGMEKNDSRESKYDFIFAHEYGEIYVDQDLMRYWSTSPDILIAYLSWLLTEPGNHTVKVEYANPFWAIHDMEHALNDESGCTIYVDEYVEYERLKDALDLFKKQGCTITYELIEEITEAYNARFGTKKSFEEYIEYELEEEY